MWLRWKTLKRTGRKHAYLAWRDENGREKTEPLHTTDRVVAEVILRTRKLEAGEIPTPPSGPALEVLEQFLAEKSLQVAPATVEQYGEKLRPLFTAWSGTPMHLWERGMWIQYVKDHPNWSPRTEELVYQKARVFIEWARVVDVPVPDFLIGYKPRRPRKGEKEVLTDKEVAALLKAAKGHYLHTPVALAVYTGLSRKDIRELAWEMVRLKERVIRRARSKSGQWMTIPIAKPLQPVLKAARDEARRVELELAKEEGRKANEKGPTGPVCPGLPLSNSSLHKALHRLCDKAKVPRGGWHRFRDTFATRLVAAGGDIAVVRRLIGHKPGSNATWGYFVSEPERELKAIKRAFG